MACRNAYQTETKKIMEATVETNTVEQKTENPSHVVRLLFGVDSMIPSNDILQNNLTEFEWVVRNKIYPTFWGRTLVGEYALTKEEIDFLHMKGCKIVPIYNTPNNHTTEEEGVVEASKAVEIALALGIPDGTAIFLELAKDKTVTRDFMRGYAQTLIEEGFTPGFKANTDAAYDFDREYSRGLQTDKDVFEKSLVWAVAPSLAEYERVTTTHLIHPDNWVPFAPSGITRNEIAVWQYGKECHPILDDAGKETTFNVNLVRNEQVIIEKMF